MFPDEKILLGITLYVLFIFPLIWAHILSIWEVEEIPKPKFPEACTGVIWLKPECVFPKKEYAYHPSLQIVFPLSPNFDIKALIVVSSLLNEAYKRNSFLILSIIPKSRTFFPPIDEI